MRMARGIARTKASIFEIEQAGHRAAQTSKTRTRVSPSTPQGTPRVVTRLSPKAAPVRLLCRRLCVGSDSLLPIIALVPQDLPDSLDVRQVFPVLATPESQLLLPPRIRPLVRSLSLSLSLFL